LQEPQTYSNKAAELALQRYPANSLYVITQDVFGTQAMDLQLAKGSIVAVIKEGDPSGNKERYFVDTGGKCGVHGMRDIHSNIDVIYTIVNIETKNLLMLQFVVTSIHV